MTDYWIIKTDLTGTVQWQKTIGASGDDVIYAIEETTSGEYLLSGYSSSNMSGDKTENCLGGFDFWVLKTDTAGNILWQNTIGGDSDDELYGAHQTSDEGYILGGYSESNISSDKTENSLGGADYWIIKLYPDTTTSLSPNPAPQERGVVIFPNPTKDEITISGYNLQNNQPAQLNIFNVMGNEVLSQPITNLHSQIINLKSFVSGVYFVQLQSGAKISRAKFVKQ